ncbi:MAG: UDP-3-O-(3-hydroxymyristoyl)glucosamine N-acyltransferase [Planctomycetota bacterium]
MQTRKTLSELAELVGGEIVGRRRIVIRGVSGIKEAHKGEITFVANRKYLGLLKETQASAVVVSKDVSDSPIPMIRVSNPDLAFARIVDAFSAKPLTFYQGIHPTAILGEDVELGKEVSIQAYSVVQPGARIGTNTIIYPGVYVGHYARIGRNCLIYPRVVIREHVRIGDNVIIHSGAIIGSDGFGFSTVEGVRVKIPQIGTVLIEDDVEIGANVTIDRARFDKTIIRKGTKIDNLCQIAHNVVIGEHTCVVAQTGIGGSVRIGKNVILAGQTGVDGHVTIGDGVQAGARSGILKDVREGAVVSGFPAQDHRRELRERAATKRVPELMNQVKELSEKVDRLERQAKNHRRRSRTGGSWPLQRRGSAGRL